MGWAIECRQSEHEVRWRDRHLFKRFADQLDAEVASIRRRLVCQCGNRTETLYFYNSGDLEADLGFNASPGKKEIVLREMEARAH